MSFVLKERSPEAKTAYVQGYAAGRKDALANRRDPFMSLGTDRVRLDFNPSKLDEVYTIKRMTAELIDLCETLKPLDGRLAALAQTAYEEACGWAVKAATTKK